MSNQRRGRQLSTENSSSPVQNLPLAASSSRISDQTLANGASSRNYPRARKWPQSNEPHHISSSRDVRSRVCVISIKDDRWIVVNVVFVDDLDENWISTALVGQLGLEVANSEVTTFGHLGNLTVEFLGSTMLQWSQENGSQCHRSQFAKCKVVNSESFNAFLNISLLPEMAPRPLVAEENTLAQILPPGTPTPELSPPKPPSPESPNFSSGTVPSVDSLSILTPVGSFDSAELEYDDNSPEAKSADDWMKRFKEYVHNRIDKPDAQRSHAQVKIAIIDTGVDTKHNFIDGATASKRIQALESFVDNEGVQDQCGHGTHVAGLVLEAAPLALIYIAKMARDMEVLRGHKIAEAITWAIGQGADIITMSFGLDEDDEDVQRAISEAVHRNVIIFAAAANHGGNKGVSYPARNDQVICVYASDGMGKPFDRNPTPPVDSFYLFTALGMAVKSYWPRDAKIDPEQRGTRRMTGTSCAAPIIAAIAACILEFAYINSFPRNMLASLKSRQGMQKVLRSLMVAENLRGGFHYIRPWSMFDDKTDQEITVLIKQCLKHN